MTPRGHANRSPFPLLARIAAQDAVADVELLPTLAKPMIKIFFFILTQYHLQSLPSSRFRRYTIVNH